MRPALLVLALVGTNILTSGCTDRFASGPADPSSFNFANGPESPGPNVFRFKDGLGIFYADPERELSAIHGGDVVEFCLTGGTTFPLVDIQEVKPKQNPDRIIQLLQADDVETTVWPFPSFDCDLFTTTPPLATGTVDLVNTDNDLLVFLRDNNNANAFGFAAHGQLMRSNGRTAHFNGVSRIVWDGEDGEKLFKETNVINLE